MKPQRGGGARQPPLGSTAPAHAGCSQPLPLPLLLLLLRLQLLVAQPPLRFGAAAVQLFVDTEDCTPLLALAPAVLPPPTQPQNAKKRRTREPRLASGISSQLLRCAPQSPLLSGQEQLPTPRSDGGFVSNCRSFLAHVQPPAPTSAIGSNRRVVSNAAISACRWLMKGVHFPKIVYIYI